VWVSCFQTPLGFEWFLFSLLLRELESTCFLRYSGALLLGFETRYQFSDESAGFLWVEITCFLWYIY